MKATPIAQYLEQKGRVGTVEWAAARREPAPITPKPTPALIALAHDEKSRAPMPFRPTGLAAAISPRSSETRAVRAEPSVAFARSREAAPSSDIDTRLSEAFHRGVQQGFDAARQEEGDTRAQERAEMQRRAVIERLDFQVNEYAKLGEAITNVLGEIERRIADSVARMMRPFVEQALINQVVEELARNIGRLRQAGRPTLLRIRGPQKWLAGLKEKVSPLALDVEYSLEENIEVSIEATDTTISSGLLPWMELLASVSERA